MGSRFGLSEQSLARARARIHEIKELALSPELECIEEGCTRKVKARGRCWRHYRTVIEMEREAAVTVLRSDDPLEALFGFEVVALFNSSRALEIVYRRKGDERMAECMAGIADLMLAEYDSLVRARDLKRRAEA